jgi:glycosyltransferase involved in cell wall biosynthesis
MRAVPPAPPPDDAGVGVAAVVLTLNEVTDLRRCVESLRWCADLVVVDSESDDGTQDLAEQLGARLFVHRQEGTYLISEQRNWALDHGGITAPWVLFVDADEVVTDALRQEICSTVATTDLDAFQLTPKFLFRGHWMRHCVGYPVWHDRLLRRGHTRLAGGVWEHFEEGTRVGRLTEPYLHHATSKGFSDWLRRHDRYSTWDAKGIVDYLRSGDVSAFGTTRRTRLRAAAARLWPTRPIVRFLVMYLLRGGFLDGPAALPFCLRYVFFEYMTVEKVVEQRRLDRGLPL